MVVLPLRSQRRCDLFPKFFQFLVACWRTANLSLSRAAIQRVICWDVRLGSGSQPSLDEKNRLVIYSNESADGLVGSFGIPAGQGGPQAIQVFGSQDR